MTTFNTFWKIVKKYKGTIILYTSMLIIFGGINLQTNNTTTTYVDKKPDILIINNDKEEGLTKNLINYINENTNIKEIKNDASFSLDRIDEVEREVKHDVIAFLTSVNESVGKENSKFIHMGLTSSDVIDTAFALLFLFIISPPPFSFPHKALQ